AGCGDWPNRPSASRRNDSVSAGRCRWAPARPRDVGSPPLLPFGARYVSYMPLQRVRTHGGSRVDVEAALAGEADEHDAGGAGGGDGEGGGGAHGDDGAEPGGPRLLHDLEAGASRDEQAEAGGGEVAVEQHPADHLVDGVVPADVLAHHDGLAVGGEGGRGVCGPRRPVDALSL